MRQTQHLSDREFPFNLQECRKDRSKNLEIHCKHNFHSRSIILHSPTFTMLLLLTALYLLRRVFALPIPAIEDRSASSCTDLNNCRTIWNIVWSCLVTTFACTWVAVHPNVPKPGQNVNQRWYSRPLRRVRIMLYTLIGPEFVIFWAWRQWKAANRKPNLPLLQGRYFHLTG